MNIVIIAIIIYSIHSIARSCRQRREATRAARRYAEQRRLVREFKAEQQRAKAERERLDRVEREQKKQSAMIAKHEEQIKKLQYRLSAAENAIDHWNEIANRLYGLLDMEQLKQSGAVPGSDTDMKCQRRIIALTNQIHAAEARMEKAKYDKQFCEKKLEVA